MSVIYKAGPLLDLLLSSADSRRAFWDQGELRSAEGEIDAAALDDLCALATPGVLARRDDIDLRIARENLSGTVALAFPLGSLSPNWKKALEALLYLWRHHAFEPDTETQVQDMEPDIQAAWLVLEAAEDRLARC